MFDLKLQKYIKKMVLDIFVAIIVDGRRYYGLNRYFVE